MLTIPFRKLGRSTSNDPHRTAFNTPANRCDGGGLLSERPNVSPPPPKRSYSATAAHTTHFLVRVQPLDRQVLFKYSAAFCLSMPVPTTSPDGPQRAHRYAATLVTPSTA